ncbi:MAG: hypothetical protein ACOCXJ_04330, partial [Planctomycetota bacterium]
AELEALERPLPSALREALQWRPEAMLEPGIATLRDALAASVRHLRRQLLPVLMRARLQDAEQMRWNQTTLSLVEDIMRWTQELARQHERMRRAASVIDPGPPIWPAWEWAPTVAAQRLQHAGGPEAAPAAIRALAQAHVRHGERHASGSGSVPAPAIAPSTKQRALPLPMLSSQQQRLVERYLHVLQSAAEEP